MTEQQTETITEFRLSYTFNAPKELVFNAFATAEALNAWWGPVQSKNSVISLDFRPGGIFHYRMEGEAGASYARFIYGSIEPTDLLEYTLAFCDEKANPVPAPFNIKFPEEVFYRLTFSEKDGQTEMQLRSVPVNATPEEEAVFRSILGSMQQGFTASFDKLSAYLQSSK